MAELRQYWALPFPKAIHLLICASTTLALALAALTLATRAPFTYITAALPTLAHHGAALAAALRARPRVATTPAHSAALAALPSVLALGVLGAAWAAATALQGVFAATGGPARGGHVAGVVLGAVETLLVCALFTLSVRDRRCLVRERREKDHVWMTRFDDTTLPGAIAGGKAAAASSSLSGKTIVEDSDLPDKSLDA